MEENAVLILQNMNTLVGLLTESDLEFAGVELSLEVNENMKIVRAERTGAWVEKITGDTGWVGYVDMGLKPLIMLSNYMEEQAKQRGKLKL